MHFSISVKGMPFLVFLKKFSTFLREYAEIRRQAEKAGDPWETTSAVIMVAASSN